MTMNIDKKTLAKLNNLDSAAEKAGGYIDKTAKNPAYNIRAMHKWCIANNRDIETLTDEERKLFKF